MLSTKAEILTAISRLPKQEQAELTEELLLTGQELSEDQELIADVRRRGAEVLSGSAVLVAGDEVRASVRRIVGQ